MQEIQDFLNSCKGEQHYLTFLLAIYTGMRRGEILGLQWSDIDLQNKIIHVKRSLAYVPKNGYFFTTLKTKKSKRQIPFPNFVLNELVNHKKRVEDWKDLVGNLFEDNNLVISTITGTFQDPRNVVRVMKRIVMRSKVTNIRFHDIRHTHASLLISLGFDIITVSGLMGHSNPKITLEFYAHLLPGAKNEIAEIFHDTIQNNDIEKDIE
ncbi:site-specific integrase [Psychrobacillus glaciei]|uniref:site-specific integrase n=1 Tax=Psychrobacillus glaciei TaxID=2283160 RepID=UPI001CEF8E71|nr:site-specific integrase [Psychrobacillus glaciei]